MSVVSLCLRSYLLYLNIFFLPCIWEDVQGRYSKSRGMKLSKTPCPCCCWFSVKAANRNANVSVGQSLQGEVISFIRPIDTVGKNRQASGHWKPFLLTWRRVCLSEYVCFFPAITVHLRKDVISSCKPCPTSESLNIVGTTVIILWFGCIGGLQHRLLHLL